MQLQPSYETRINRFPKIFERVKAMRPDARRILSFGCSSGEEAFTLAELFPNAEIVGVDIQQYLLHTARRNNKFPDRVFFHDELGGTGQYDLVFCLMVLFCIQNPIPKEEFIKTLTLVDRHVNSDGILTIYTAEYNPMEVPAIESGYKRIKGWKHTHNINKKDYFDGYYKKNTGTDLITAASAPLKRRRSWQSWLLGG